MGWYKPEGYTDEEALASVGKGWQPLVAEVLDKMDRVKFKVTQVKEKFGALRIYVDPAIPGGGYALDDWDKMDNLTFGAEAKSRKVCADCGAPAETHRVGQSGWWVTLCPDCENKAYV